MPIREIYAFHLLKRNDNKGGLNISVYSIKKDDNPERRLDLIGSCLNNEKTEGISYYDLRGKTPMADYMIIVTGRSSTHVKALADKIVERCKDFHIKNIRTEGTNPGDWVVVDAGDVIVHLFRKEVREFYDLDKLWQECIMDYELADKKESMLV